MSAEKYLSSTLLYEFLLWAICLMVFRSGYLARSWDFQCGTTVFVTSVEKMLPVVIKRWKGYNLIRNTMHSSTSEPCDVVCDRVIVSCVIYFCMRRESNICRGFCAVWYHFNSLAVSLPYFHTRFMVVSIVMIGRLWRHITNIVFYYCPAWKNGKVGKEPSADVAFQSHLHRECKQIKSYLTMVCVHRMYQKRRLRNNVICSKRLWQDLRYVVTYVA